MKNHLPLLTFGILLFNLSLSSCSDQSESSETNESPDAKNAQSAAYSTEGLNVKIASDALNSFVSRDTLEQITQNLFEYFKSTNEANWDQLMHHFPLHKNSDTAFVNSSKRALDYWTERGVQNRTEMAEIVYASPVFEDGDQEVVLINMKLRHYVEFLPLYDGPSPS